MWACTCMSSRQNYVSQWENPFIGIMKRSTKAKTTATRELLLLLLCTRSIHPKQIAQLQHTLPQPSFLIHHVSLFPRFVFRVMAWLLWLLVSILLVSTLHKKSSVHCHLRTVVNVQHDIFFYFASFTRGWWKMQMTLGGQSQSSSYVYKVINIVIKKGVNSPPPHHRIIFISYRYHRQQQ